MNRDPADIIPDLIDVGIREALRDRVSPTRTRTGTVLDVNYEAKTADVRVDGDHLPTATRLLCEAFPGARVVVDFTTGGGVWCKGIIGGSAVWLPYQPTWATAIAQPVLGNGSLRGWFMRVGQTVHIQIELLIGSTTNGGTGETTLTLPFAVPTTTPEQTLHTVRLFHPTLGHYFGFGVITTAAAILPILPINNTENRMLQLRNADASGAVNTGSPQLAGTYPLISGGRLHILGTYRLS